MATFNNGESLSSVRTKINAAIDKVDGNATISNDITFGDNNKAIFGAGSDLQIYHDGSHSYIQDAGTGNLRFVAGDRIQFYNNDQTELFAQFINQDKVELRFDNAIKFETTSTGADITGTLTADGLTVDGDVLVKISTANYTEGLTLRNTANWGYGTSLSFEAITSSGGSNAEVGRIASTWNTAGYHGLDFYTLTNNTLLRHMRLDGYGDFSLYEDQGITPKFVWKAADERLGLGTDLPSQALHVVNPSTSYVLAETTGTGTSAGVRLKGDASADYTLFTTQGTNQFAIYDNAAATERLRVTSSGSVGIATSSPATTLDVAGTTTTDGLNLDAIAATISDTAVDIFVYDTRKDSDGGAWRKRTQHTSWYNETLNTATRGSRKEFPAVAVIVYSSSSKDITIYDGDDPDMPMWMVFQDSGGEMLYTGGTPSSVTALNGEIVSGQSGVGALCHFNFIKDYGYLRINSSSEYNGSNIAKRNNNFSSDTITGTTGALVSRSINDVAMTVLPNAPIDAATGLPVPTIAVATAAGTSVIRDDGTVVDIKYTWTTVTTKSVSFTDANEIAMLMHGTASGGGTGLLVGPIPSSDTTASSDLSAYFTEYRNNGTLPFCNSGDQWKEVVAYTDDNLAIAFNGTGKMLRIIKENQEAPSDGLVSFITSDYNTGWMNGDIKLATLSDTDATNVTGSELVTNGTFDTDISGWTAGNGATLSLASNTLRVTNVAGAAGYAYQSITTVVGKRYVASATLTAGTSTAQLSVGTTSTASNLVAITTNGYGTFVATTTTTYIRVVNGTSTSGQYSDYDNISVRLAEADRSVNNNGLQVFGTVTKSAVATGADLVAYSGFSSSNYLEQPYNSDLDFGTGDFCYMGWVKTTTGTGKDVWVQRTDGGTYWGTNATVIMQHTNGEFLVQAGGSWDVTSGAAINDGKWHYVTVVRRNGVVSAYWDATLKITFAGASAQANGDDVLRFGIGMYNGGFGDGHDGSLALWRISATAPSPEQILKIYNDEKFLFQDNAQATLYGSSDAVTALAYDDSTDLLHVGTSAGRSVFQGLRRVDNTTTAVGAAISASGGLVADE